MIKTSWCADVLSNEWDVRDRGNTMKKVLKKFFTSLLVVSTLAISQVALLQTASAADGDFGDIRVLNQASGTEVMSQGFFDNSWISVCNDGNAAIKSISFQNDTTGWDLTSLTIQERQEWNTATDLGSITLEGVWTGLVEPSQCFTIFQWGTVDGEVGTNAVHTVTVSSSVLYDDTANVDPEPSNDTSTLTRSITPPVYATNLTPYIGDSGFTYPTVWDGFIPQYQWVNICSWGIGTLKSFQVDITTENWINTSFELDTSPWSNDTVLDPGSITSDGLWTGQLQVNECINLRAYGEVSGEIGEDAVWTATVSDGVFVDDTLNVDTNSSDDTATLVQPIQEPVYSLELGSYVGNNNTEFMFQGQFQNTWIHVCSTGYGSVESMNFEFETQNWTLESLEVDTYVHPSNNNATDLGSISMDGEWNGTLEAGQCIVFRATGPITGNLGDTVSWTVNLASSTLTGGEPNVDGNLSNNEMTISAPIAETGDLAIQTRLMTPGEIADGSNISYEVEVQNIGAGTITDSLIGLYYILPEGASWIGITDLDVQDDLVPLGCVNNGPVAAQAPSLSAYSGDVIQCGLQGPADGITPGSSYPIRLDLEASEGFVSGETEVYGVALSGNIQEPDSATFVMEIQSGRDPFRLGMNNIMHLVYDNNELQVTINRCEGIGENVSEDDACFTVEFSKPVWAASFDVNDLVLVGGGNVYSFVQDSSTKWTVRINGMTPGGTLQLLLGAASVSDYSAVSNGVEVLGENMVRYTTGSGDSPNGNEETVAVTTNNGTSSNSGSASKLISAGIQPGVAPTAASDSTPLLGITSGLIAEIPKLFSIDISKSLILGKWSLTQNNVLDFSIIIVNLAGLAALMFVAFDRKKVLI